MRHLSEALVQPACAVQSLNLRGTSVSDVSALGQLNNLQSLDLRETQVSDVSAIKRPGLTIHGVS